MDLEKTKIFVWQTSVEHLEYYMWLEVQKYFKTPFIYLVSELQNSIRVAQNWKMVKLEGLHPVILPPNQVWREGKKKLQENPDAIHCFWGFRGSKKFNTFPLILYALHKGIKVVVMNEPYSTSPVGYYSDEPVILARIKTLVRPVLHYLIAGLTRIFSKSHKPCIMALSLIAKNQYLKAGYDPKTIFPFGYFVPKQQVSVNRITSSSKLRLIFVGALIKRKGIDILEQAVKYLYIQGYKIELDIYGAGMLKVDDPDLPIHYRGTLPYDEIQAVIAEHDVLILPSRHDGWGAVVNEALLQGVPVIVSDQVGAKCLVESSGAGLIFHNEEFQDLGEKLKKVIEEPAFLTHLREKASQIGVHILPEAGARYLVDVIAYFFYGEGSSPQAPWCGQI